MSNKLHKKNKKTESFLTNCYLFFGHLVDYVVCIYMLLIIAVMPFYFQREQGFKTIGTSKHLFFKWTIQHIGPPFAAVLLGYAICGLLHLHKETTEGIRGAVKKWIASCNIVDLCACAYGISAVVSYLTTPYKSATLWGATGWYMGLIPQLASVVVYFAVSTLWKRHDWMFSLFLPVSAVVFLLGILNRFGIYPINMQMEVPNFISTIGNINWYCGYLVSVFFAGVYLLWQKPVGEKMLGTSAEVIGRERIKRFLLIAYVMIGFASLVTQGSLSGFLALGMVFLVLFVHSSGQGRRMERFWMLVCMLTLVCTALWGVRRLYPEAMTFTDGVIDLVTDSVLPLVLAVLAGGMFLIVRHCNRQGHYSETAFRILSWIAVGLSVLGFVTVVGMIAWNTLHPGSLGRLSSYSFFTFSPTWGSNRGATWEAGVMCLEEMNWKQRLFGVGPDGMEAFINDVGSEQLLAVITERFPGLRLTNAHCELLNIWINMGLFGAISFAGMMFGAIVRFLKDKKGNAVIMGACGLCVLAYMTNNLVSFQQSMSLATIFVVLGIGRAYERALAGNESR